MARHSLSAMPARIFTKRRSLGSRILSGLLLTLSLAVTLAGLSCAIYLDRARDAAPPASPVAVLSVPPSAPLAATRADAAPTLPLAAAAAVPVAAPIQEPVPVDPRPAASVPVEPPTDSATAGSSAAAIPAPLPQLAAREMPPAAPAPAAPPAEVTGPSGQYWVEFGVFVGERYAQRLQLALADRGVAASVVIAHAPGGRPLWRVRSPAAGGAQARMTAASAEQAFAIATLIHRVTIAASEPAPAPTIALAPPVPGGDPLYWVQFGAFPHQPQALRLQEALRQGGIDTVISPARATSGRSLFVVRSIHVPDRDSALTLARRGQQAANVDFLIGRNRAAAEPRHGAARALPSRSAG